MVSSTYRLRKQNKTKQQQKTMHKQTHRKRDQRDGYQKKGGREMCEKGEGQYSQ